VKGEAISFKRDFIGFIGQGSVSVLLGDVVGLSLN
jgi:hypothetical protein